MPLRYHARYRIENEVCTEIPGVDDAEMLQDWQNKCCHVALFSTGTFST